MSNPRRRRRLRHHLALAGGSLALLLLTIAVQSGEPRARLSTALAYVALALLGVTLSIGPRNLLLGRPNPVSSDLRRDCGIWTAVLALMHVSVGLTVHFTGQMQAYFFIPADQPDAGQLRLDPFGVANHTGAMAAIGFLFLALLSSDAWLARLGAPRWKRWQRSVYLLAGLTVAHGILYIVLEKRQPGFIAVFAALCLAILVSQGAGVGQVRRRLADRRVHPRPDGTSD